jgi:hypothetical protein
MGHPALGYLRGYPAGGFGVEGGDGGVVFVVFGLVFLWVGELLVEVIEEEADVSFGAVLAVLGAGGEDAEGGVEDDLFDGVGRVAGVGVSFRGVFAGRGGGEFCFGEVGAGDLESVEEEPGAARVDVVGGDAAEDFADGGLDGGAVFGVGEFEGGTAAAALARVGDGAAGGVVVVAELLAAQAGAEAAVAVGEDVAAAVFGFGLLDVRCGLRHGGSPSGFVVQNLQKKRPAPGLRRGRPGMYVLFGGSVIRHPEAAMATIRRHTPGLKPHVVCHARGPRLKPWVTSEAKTDVGRLQGPKA